MIKTFLAVFTFISFSFSFAASGDAKEQKLFIFEKSYNPENILVISARTNDQCQFEKWENNEFYKMYWLMDGEDYKDPHSLIKKELRKRISLYDMNEEKNRFKIKLNDLEGLDHDFEEAVVTVETLFDRQGDCNVSAVIPLGGSADYQKLELKSVYSRVKTNWLGLPKTKDPFEYIDLKGLNYDSKDDLTIRYFEK
ncbi:MAG: hypothetical protein WD025_04340 [Bacteriovoracaceae bacterium]